MSQALLGISFKQKLELVKLRCQPLLLAVCMCALWINLWALITPLSSKALMMERGIPAICYLIIDKLDRCMDVFQISTSEKSPGTTKCTKFNQ